jgi:ferrochelatase
MRYGRPSIAAAIGRLADAGAERAIAFPLFAQQSGAATGSAVARVREAAGERGLALDVVPPFFAHRAYLEARAASIRSLLSASFDRVFFTFHGLPERQVRRADATGRRCLDGPDCCGRLDAANGSCYRAQCFETARRLSARLGLSPGQGIVCFQSRLGRSPWIGPATDEVLAAEARRGARRALVVPSFVADCLETLEELGLRGAEIWRANGGESLTLAPALNAVDRWVDAVIEIASDASPAFAAAAAAAGARA